MRTFAEIVEFYRAANLREFEKLREREKKMAAVRIAYNEEFALALDEGHFYLTREGKVIGPLRKTPKLLNNSNQLTWYWYAGDDDRMHWTVDGRWYQERSKPSPHDLALDLGIDDAMFITGLKWTPEQQKGFAKASGSTPAPAPVPMTKRALLEAAIVATADRGLNYGKPEDNFARIAAHWSAYLANSVRPTEGPLVITPTDVAIMCALLKIARLENDPRHQDSWVDLAGYAACGAEIALKGTGTTHEATNQQGREGDYGWESNKDHERAKNYALSMAVESINKKGPAS